MYLRQVWVVDGKRVSLIWRAQVGSKGCGSREIGVKNRRIYRAIENTGFLGCIKTSCIFLSYETILYGHRDFESYF